MWEARYGFECWNHDSVGIVAAIKLGCGKRGIDRMECGNRGYRQTRVRVAGCRENGVWES